MEKNKFCTECGSGVKPTAKFCESCGFKFVTINKNKTSVSLNKNPAPQNNSSSQWTQLPTSNFQLKFQQVFDRFWTPFGLQFGPKIVPKSLKSAS